MDQADHQLVHGLETAKRAVPKVEIAIIDQAGSKIFKVDASRKGAPGAGDGDDANIRIIGNFGS